MSINRTKIDAASEAVRSASVALEDAEANHLQEIVKEAERAIQRRSQLDLKREAAAENLRGISESKAGLEEDEERSFAAYQRASYQGDNDAAQAAQDAGDVARGQLVSSRADEEQARLKLEAVSYDDSEADEELNFDLSTLINLAPEEKREEVQRSIFLAQGPLRKQIQARTEARQMEEHRRKVEASQELDNMARLPNGTIDDGKRQAILRQRAREAAAR